MRNFSVALTSLPGRAAFLRSFFDSFILAFCFSSLPSSESTCLCPGKRRADLLQGLDRGVEVLTGRPRCSRPTRLLGKQSKRISPCVRHLLCGAGSNSRPAPAPAHTSKSSLRFRSPLRAASCASNSCTIWPRVGNISACHGDARAWTQSSWSGYRAFTATTWVQIPDGEPTPRQILSISFSISRIFLSPARGTQPRITAGKATTHSTFLGFQRIPGIGRAFLRKR